MAPRYGNNNIMVQYNFQIRPPFLASHIWPIRPILMQAAKNQKGVEIRMVTKSSDDIISLITAGLSGPYPLL